MHRDWLDPVRLHHDRDRVAAGRVCHHVGCCLQPVGSGDRSGSGSIRATISMPQGGIAQHAIGCGYLDRCGHPTAQEHRLPGPTAEIPPFGLLDGHEFSLDLCGDLGCKARVAAFAPVREVRSSRRLRQHSLFALN